MRWVTYAEQQRESLPEDARRKLNKLLDLLAVNPRGHGTYSKRDDQWIATFGDGWGLVIYTIEDRWITITVLPTRYLGRVTQGHQILDSVVALLRVSWPRTLKPPDRDAPFALSG